MRRGPTTALAAAWLTIAGCSEGANFAEPLGTAREADGKAPVIEYPIDFAPAERVPTSVGQVFLASRGEDFLAVWFDSLPPSALKAVRFDRDGAPATKSPIALASSGPLLQPQIPVTACAPAGDCVVVSTVFDPGEQLDVSTLRADGTKVAHELANTLPGPPPAVAYDPDANAFLVVWSAPELLAQHVADGLPVEPAPFLVAPQGQSLTGLACAPGSGCLVLISPDGSARSALVVSGSSVSPPVTTAPFSGSLTYGDGVYFTVAPLDNGYGVVRLGLDGSMLDTAPIPIASLGQTYQRVIGSGFDGAAFTLFVHGYDQPDGTPINLANVAGRVLAEGTSPVPASIDITSYTPYSAVACGDGSCELALEPDARGAQALSTLAIRGGVAKASAHDLDLERTSQQLGAALAIGDEIFAAWGEGEVLRTRWVASGGAAGPTKDVNQGVFLRFADANQGAGLLVLEAPDGTRKTRVVHAGGEVGEAVPLEPPASAKVEPARFGVADDSRPDGSVYLLRFDAAGRALDPDGILLAAPSISSFTPAMVERSGDTFVALTRSHGTGGSLLRISRVRDTGAPIDVTPLDAQEIAGAMFAGVGCSAVECVIALDRGSEPKGPKREEVWLARFAAHDPEVHIAVSKLDAGTGGMVVFDGAHFLIVYTREQELRVARLDDDGPRFASSQLDADSLDVAASTGDGTALLFAEFPTTMGNPQRDVERIDVRLVLGEGLPGGGSTGASTTGAGGGEPAPPAPPAVARGCACELGEERGRSWPAALLALIAASFAARRARR